jgi:hypothetical protein
MIAGRIEGVALKARTSQFGPVQVKLADMRGLRSQAIDPEPIPQNPPPVPPVKMGQLWMKEKAMEQKEEPRVRMLPPRP